MSVKTMTKVWEWSRSEGTTRLVLLALADHTDDDGFCWPGIKRLAEKCKISERTAQRCLRDLEELGEVVVAFNDGKMTATGKTNRYQVVLTRGDKSTPVTLVTPRGDKSGSQGVTPMSPKSSLEPSGKRQVGDADSLESIYQAYPRKTAKQAALKAIRSALKKTSVEDLLEKTKAYGDAIRSSKADMAYVPHPATWFNSGRYTDDPDEWIRSARGNRDAKGHELKAAPKPRKTEFETKIDHLRHYLVDGGSQSDRERALTFVQTLTAISIPAYLSANMQSTLHELLAEEGITLE